MNKRIISGLVAVVLALSGGGCLSAVQNAVDFGFDITASAEIATSGTCGENLTWTLKNKTLTISGTGPMYDYWANNYDSQNYFHSTIPWFESINNIHRIVIEDGVTSIGDNAFGKIYNLKSVTIPGSVKRIGECAFKYCRYFYSITIPEGVESIEHSAFYYCKELNSITLPNSLKSLGGSAFNECNISSITIPDGITTIGYKTFYLCKRLREVHIPDSVTSIGGYAFFGCDYLSDINFPDSITNFGKSAFYGCDSLTNLTFPKSMTTIGDNAFGSCTGLTQLTIPDHITTIEKFAFAGCKNLTEITIPDSVTSIGSYAFYQCSHLKNITIPNSITSISDGIFYECANLKSVTIPDSVTSIEPEAFCTCLNLKNINIPDSVTSIGSKAFCNCKSLENVTLSKKLKSIGENAFRDCTALTSITIPASVTKIYDMALGSHYDKNTMKSEKNDDFTIRCYKDTAGEAYAVENGYDYELLETFAIKNPDVTMIPGNNCVGLKWNAVPGAEKYAVYGLVDDKWQKFSETANTSYTVNNLTAGTNYKVAVIAMFGGEWNTDFSKAITVTANDNIASKYPKVTDIVYNEQFHQFKVNWDAVDGAEKYGVAVFIANKWRIVNQDIPANKTNFTSPKLKAGQTYKMVVCAKVNGKWDTGKINERTFTVKVI